MIATVVFGFLPLAIWLYLLAGHGLYWTARERDDRSAPQALAHFPSIAAIVPARNEGDVIARSIGSLLAQDYPGLFRIILVDDESEDGTAQIARNLPGNERLSVISGTIRPTGWTGKLWAVSQGIAEAGNEPAYLWLTDADIAHAPDNLRGLVARAESGGLVLTSLMARLQCQNAAERFYIPAFVYFFQMLYPFARVNDPKSRTAAAAGGCVLVRREALERAGGIAAIRNAIIDDCAMGRLMKAQGPIWLGLTGRATSIRPYANIGEIRLMVARSAYAQLGYSPLILAGTLAALGIVFVAPPLMAIFGTGAGRIAAFLAWLLMAVSFGPMLRFYGRSPVCGLALPVTGFVYAAFTLDSALKHWQGKGGMWKGSAASHGEIVNGTSETAGLAPGKGHRDENFPVASLLIHPRHRPAILAFYRFARAADDIADNAHASADEKLRLLEEFRFTLVGDGNTVTHASNLRDVLKARNLTPQHAFDLLEAFRRDATTLRYPNWDSLAEYCRYSAMPVGRFMLDVHAEARDTWEASDALCTALQVVNHLQDCQKDYRTLDRVYLPQDQLAAAGVDASALDAATASPALRRVLEDLTRRTVTLLTTARPLAGQIRDTRLALEVTVIQKLAEDLCGKLLRNDPLSERVHHNKVELVPLLLGSFARFAATRRRRTAQPLSLAGDPR